MVRLHSCRETSLGHRGTQGLRNQAPLCLAWTARLEKCLALEALCTHERTHWKDIRLRWEEEARGQEKEKSRIFTVRALWSDYWGIYWTPTVDFVIQLHLYQYLYKGSSVKTAAIIVKWQAWMAKEELWSNIYACVVAARQLVCWEANLSTSIAYINYLFFITPVLLRFLPSGLTQPIRSKHLRLSEMHTCREKLWSCQLNIVNSFNGTMRQ